MKILAIDYLTYKGHRNFNKIHVEALARAGHAITVVGRLSAIESINDEYCRCRISLPDWNNRKFPLFGVTERVKNALSLLWIKRNVGFNQFDAVVFLAYDALSLSTLRIDKPVYLVNHNNVSQLKNKVKCYITKHLPTNYEHVTLTVDSEKRLKELLPLREVHFVPHGYLKATRKAKCPPCIGEGDRFVFCPVNRWVDVLLMNDIMNSIKVNDYLKDKKVKFIVKKTAYNSQASKQVVYIDGFISDDEYLYLLKNAEGVVLPYNKDFQYRSSGILFECMANDVPVLATDITAMRQYEDKMNISFFNNEPSFISSLDRVIRGNESPYDKAQFEPLRYWNETLNKK